MKKIKEWKKFGKVFEDVEEDIIELEDVCVWMSDRVDSLTIKPNGEGHYNIEISYERSNQLQDGYPNLDLSNIVQNAEEMNELTKEYAELILRFDAMGYELSYHLLNTTHHKNFYRFNGKIQLRKT